MNGSPLHTGAVRGEGEGEGVGGEGGGKKGALILDGGCRASSKDEGKLP